MRYVCKTDSPDFFNQEKEILIDDSSWKNLHCKNKLRLHLIAEQKNLCVYCERKINENNSHIEHVSAQSNDPTMRFEYENLVASCNGDQCNPCLKDSFRPEDINSCGHKKSNDMDENLFLNPIRQKNIAEYFSYDNVTCAICPSQEDEPKATYTITLLGLDNNRLNLERSNARSAFSKTIKRYPPTDYKSKIRGLLSKSPPFVSFLQFYYSPFLK